MIDTAGFSVPCHVKCIGCGTEATGYMQLHVVDVGEDPTWPENVLAVSRLSLPERWGYYWGKLDKPMCGSPERDECRLGKSEPRI